MLRNIYSALSPGVRNRLKRLLGAGGHGRSIFDPMKGRHLARGKKRLDIAAQRLASSLRLAGVLSLKGTKCLELGVGYVLSEPLLFYLLGCKNPYATDYNDIASISATYQAVQNSTSDAVANALSGFELPADFEKRLHNLFGLNRAEFPSFLKQVITYRAPYDGSREEPICQFDLIHSTSVLEHIPLHIVAPLLTNFAGQLASKGVWINSIDLRDHYDFDRAPFAFLADDTDWSEHDADVRGNRLRKTHWLNYFSSLPLTTECVSQLEAQPETLPTSLIAECSSLSRSELAIAEITLVSRAP
jgi:hypothetical protein